MPVLGIDLKRLSRMVGADKKRILDRLPYIGLDIESVDGNTVRVEFSPNRPDFGTDFGIARAIRGILGKELGSPVYESSPSGITVSVDRRLSNIRPFISCATATGVRFDDEDIRQILSLQEDLHNGIGRRRRVVAIGLHDLDRVSPPLEYRAVQEGFKFTPLGSDGKLTIRRILAESEQGRTYGHILASFTEFPVITDADGTVLSFPPIINGEATRVSTETRNLFIDVTSTNAKAGDDIMAILITTLAEAGAKIGSVGIRTGRRARTTPDLRQQMIPLDTELVEQVVGLGLKRPEVVEALGRSRLTVRGREVMIPRYRIDLLHPVDLAEEVALGYGIDRIKPLYPPSKQPGSFNRLEEFLDRTSTLMAGAGMIELMTYELVDSKSLYAGFGRLPDSSIAVHDPRSLEHSILRDSLIPSLMSALSYNVKEDYPQRVFEIGRVYSRADGGVVESWRLGCLVAHAQSTYTEAKKYLEAVFTSLIGAEASTKAHSHWAFVQGRCAAVEVNGEELGHIGEVKPESLSFFKLNVPVAGFEIDLSRLHKQLK